MFRIPWRCSKIVFFANFRPFSRFLRPFWGSWGTRGPGIGKLTQKQFFCPEQSRKMIIKMPENRPSKFPEKCKCLGPVFRHFYHAFPSFLGREKSFLRELSDPRPLSPPKARKSAKVWEKGRKMPKRLEKGRKTGCSEQICWGRLGHFPKAFTGK